MHSPLGTRISTSVNTAIDRTLEGEFNTTAHREGTISGGNRDKRPAKYTKRSCYEIKKKVLRWITLSLQSFTGRSIRASLIPLDTVTIPLPIWPRSGVGPHFDPMRQRFHRPAIDQRGGAGAVQPTDRPLGGGFPRQQTLLPHQNI
jgi:hypothetical protein